VSRSAANVLWLGIKELRSIRADRVLLFLILYSFSYAIYAVATGAKLEVEHVAVAIVDEDRSELSRAIASAIREPLFRPPQEIAATGIDAAMDANRFVFVIEIPPRFEADLLAERRPVLQINVDATAMAQAGNGAIYLQEIIGDVVLTRLRRPDASTAAPIRLVMRARFNPNAQSHWFTAVMQVINNITILSVILTGAALIREREHGTIEHLMTMPVTPSEIMLSKIWANGLIVLVAALASLRIVVELLLEVPIAGSLVLFVAGALVYQFAVTALGLLIATFTTSMSQFGLLAMPVLVVMNLLSGSTTPMETMPDWLQTAMQILPSTHFVAFAQAVLYRAAGIDIVWPQLVAIAVISAAFFALSLLRFRFAVAAAQ
jgi:ABC-2 type transport system permease protein